MCEWKVCLSTLTSYENELVETISGAIQYGEPIHSVPPVIRALQEGSDTEITQDVGYLTSRRITGPVMTMTM